MSKEIDERVVSMQFDNALFEKNIQKSLKSIDDLNKSLNNLDGAKGLEEVGKAAKEVDLTPIIASAKSAEKSFSALEIAGITTISRLTNSLINFGAKMGKNFWDSTIGQIKSGGWKRASDIKAGKFMLEGLGLGDKNVELLSEAAQKAVKGTAAGLGEAMKSAGVLATSGLKDAQKMEETLKGIAGMSAMTGRSFENIANIYSTIASNGKLMTMQMRQFSFAGINVAAELAKQMDTTEAAINDMVTKGQIDFQTFADAMTKAFGDHAKDANKTFTGALANMKAALSRIGEQFATPFMDNAKDVFNVLRVFFDSVKEAMGPIFEDFSQLMKLGNMFIHKVFSPFVERARDAKGEIEWKAKDQKILSNIVEGIRNIYSTVILVFKTIGEAFREVFPSLEDTSEGFKDITRSIMPTRQGLELLKTILIPILEILKTVGTVLKYTITFASYFVKVIAAVVHALTGATGGFTEWMKRAREGKTLATALENVFDILAGAILGLGAAIIGILSLIQKLIKKLGGLFKFDFSSIKQIGVNIISGICKGLEEGFGILQKVWTAIASFIPDTIKSILKIKSPSRVMVSVGDNIMAGLVKGMAKGENDLESEVEDTGNIFNKIIDFGAAIADALGKTAWGAIEGLISLFKKFTGKVDDANLKKTTATLIETKEVMNDIYMAGAPSSGVTSKAVQMGDDWIETNENVEKSTSSLADKVSIAYSTISAKMEELGINIDAFKFILAGFGVALVATFTQAAFSLDLLSGLGRTIATLSVIAGAFILLKNVDFGPVIEGIKALFTNLKNFADNLNVVDNIKKFFTTIRTIVEENNMVLLAAKALAFTFSIVIIRTIHNLANLATNISNSVGVIAEAIKGLTNFKLGLYETAADKVLKFAISISVIVVALTTLAKAFSEDTTAMTTAIAVIGGLIAFIGAFTLLAIKASKSKDTNKIATEAMKQMLYTSYAILGIVTAFVLLATQMNKFDWDSAIMAFTSFGAVLISFGAFLKFLNKMEVNISPGTVISISVFIIAISKMMKDFGVMLESTKNIDDLALAFTKMVAPILAALAGIALILNSVRKMESSTTNKYRGKGLIGFINGIIGSDKDSKQSSDVSANAAKTLLSMSALLLTIGGIMKIFASFNVDEMNTAITGMSVAFVLFAGLCITLQHYEAPISFVSGFARDFAIAVLALTTTAALISKMNVLEFTNAYERIKDISILVGGIVVVTALLTKILVNGLSELTVKIKGLGITLVGIAVGLAALGTVFALIPKDRLNKFVEWTESIVRFVLAAVLAFSLINVLLDTLWSSDVDSSKAKNPFMNMLGMLLGIGVVLGALVVLSVMDPASLLIPISVISLILMELTLMFAQIGKMKDVSNAKAIFVSLAVIIGFISSAIVALSLIPMDPGKMAEIGVSFGIVIGALCGLMLSLSKLNEVKIDKSIMGTLGIITGLVAVIGGIALAIAAFNVDTKNLGLAFAGIFFIVLEMIGLFAVIDNMKVDTSVMASLGIMAGVVAAIGIFLTLLASLGGDKAMGAAGAMAIVIGITVGFIALCGVIGTFLPGATLILGSFATVITALGVALLTAGVGISLVLLTLSGALGVIAVCLQMLQSIDFDYVAGGLLKMAGATIAFGLAMSASIVLIGGALSVLIGQISKIMLSLLPFFAVIGGFLMIGLSKGIKRESKKAVDAALAAADGVTKTTMDAFEEKSPSKLFRKIGQFLLDGLALGIIDKIPFVGNTIKEFVKNIADWFNGKADELEKTGDTWGNAIKSGLSDAFGEMDFEIPSLSNEISELTNGFDLESIAADDTVGSLEGYTDATSDAISGTDNLNNSMANAIDMFTEFNDQAYMTSKDVLPAFMSQIEGVAKWRDELASLSARGLGEVIVQELEQMGPQAYEKMHALYTMTNSELAMMNIMYKQKLALQNGSIKKIDKSFKKLGDTVNETMEKSMDEMNDNMVNSMDSMAGNMMKALKKQMDYEKVINQVTGFRDNIADKIRNSMSIFEAVNEQEEIKAEELLKNMKDQVKHVGKWASMITEMAAKGFDEGLVATLTDMGPQSYSKVAAFLTMSEEQIAEANRLYEASEQVPEYGADKIVKAFAQAGFTASMGLTDSFLEGLDPEAVEQAMSDLGQRSITSLQDEIANKPYEIGELIPSDFADGLVAAAEAETGRVQEAMQDLVDAANPENYLPEVGNEDLAADMIKAYGSKAVEDARKANTVNDETNRAIWAERDKNKYNQIYQEEQKKSYTPNKNYDFVYKTSSGGNKKLHDLLYAQYGESMYDFVEQIYDETGKLLNEYYDFGKLLSTGILQDNSADEALKKYLRVIVDNAQGNIDSLGYYDLGKNIAFTTSNGVEESTKYMSDAGDALMASELGGMAGDSRYATKKVKDIVRADIKSMPIGKGLIEFGAGIGDSTAEGINTEGIVAMEEAGQNLAGSFIISLRDNLASLMDAILNSDDTTAPKIKPVFDGSNVIDGIKSLFNKNIDLSTSANIDVSTKNRDKSVVDAINAMSNNKDVVNAVNDLRDMFSMRVNDLMNMSVVMDTGALVGQLSGPIDYNLGSRSMYAGRGVI